MELGEVARDAVGVRGEVRRVEEGLTFAPGTGELAGAVPETVQENGESGGGVEGVVAFQDDSSGEGGDAATRGSVARGASCGVGGSGGECRDGKVDGVDGAVIIRYGARCAQA